MDGGGVGGGGVTPGLRARPLPGTLRGGRRGGGLQLEAGLPLHLQVVVGRRGRTGDSVVTITARC